MPKILLGHYSYDVPIQRLSTFAGISYQEKFFTGDSLLNQLFPFQTTSQKLAIYVLNSKKAGPLEEKYDCINWAIGHRRNVLSHPLSDLQELCDLLKSLGFNSLPIQGRTSGEMLKASNLCLFLDKSGNPVHIHVKLNIQTDEGFQTFWTSKIGTIPLILAYPCPHYLWNFYKISHQPVDHMIYFETASSPPCFPRVASEDMPHFFLY